jgi:hypothetical protein
MGMMSLTMAGAFPLAALVTSFSAPAIGSRGTLIAFGVVTLLAATALSWRRAIRTA